MHTHQAIRRASVALAALAALALAPSQAAAQEADDTFSFGDETQAFFLAGVTTGGSFGSLGGGGFVGADLSVAWLRDGLWGGLYADGVWDFGHGAATVSVGPEIGYMVLGLDGGPAARFGRADDPEFGFQARGMIALGLVSIYGRYGGWPQADGIEHVGQVGLTFKLPVWTSYESRAAAP